jgi:hypothetical protein
MANMRIEEMGEQKNKKEPKKLKKKKKEKRKRKEIKLWSKKQDAYAVK